MKKQTEKQHIDHPIPPVYDEYSRILILGSFPSVASRAAAFFYGHPRNRFWKVISSLYGERTPEETEEKKAFLLRNGIALWDTIASCDIHGSSDSSIENVVANDLSEILKTAEIRTIFCNGSKSHELYMKYIYPVTGIEAVRLPSTSPANAAMSEDKLKKAWEEAGAGPESTGENAAEHA